LLRVLELANKQILGRELSDSGAIRKSDFKICPKLPLGSTGDIEKVLKESNDDTLIVVRQNLHKTDLQNGYCVDPSTDMLRSNVSKSCHRSSGRNIGLIILSDPKQGWVDRNFQKKSYSFRFKKVDEINEANRSNLLIKDYDNKIVLATPRREDFDEQVTSIVNHFAQIIE
jgi:hypothetical protein